MANTAFNYKYITAISLVSALGGLLFGYDWVVIGGAKPFYEQFFQIANNSSMQGWAMSSALLGCVLGAVLSGFISDLLGRKKSLIIASVLFTISALGTGLADNFSFFIIYRVIGGIGIGLASTISPMYIAEVAPAKFRGRFVSINQLSIVIGILAAQIVNWLIAEPIPESVLPEELLHSWNGQTGWRIMFLAELVPAILFFVLMFLIPMSPRFLIKFNKEEKALAVLKKIGGNNYAFEELNSIKSTFQNSGAEKPSLSDFKSSKVKRILIIGLVLAVFQQWCGINIIFNYAQEIFTAAGYSVGDMLFNIVITGSVNLIFTLVAMKTVDSWGRRKLMLLGSLGLAIVYLVLGTTYYFEFKGLPVLILVITAIGIYSMSLAPITWVVLSEIFPNKIRGIAMSLATFALWIACFMLTFTFPLLNEALGAYGTFYIYSGICVLGFLFILKKLPETKGKTLEEIENEI
ncbi:sugar porter family MFS transporter [Tamlana fucoidanivorans]|uniref:Sugar porter family MFS transporter n=1 Tax=Allotamlana fucoidanivorans TaxID=2583814 RepID=A0A5C4SPV2_9FLAO|nr:sugar porter family MFS transporter [Tamlana fucoidanivorans]TNJ45843.1 sugar porter family MFS transporter [Tamlana fucoidanivorans]